MLELHISATDLWDPVSERFLSIKEQVLPLEHSLLSVSKWEEKWHKPMPLINDKSMKGEEFLDYIRCMTIARKPDPLVYKCVTQADVQTVLDYINDPHTATWFGSNESDSSDKRPLTAELIYHLMFSFGISKECEKWHFNRLMTQLRVEYEESKPSKKKSKAEIAERHRYLNAKRRAEAKARAKMHR